MFDMGPSGGGGFPDWLKKKTGGNTGVTGGMRNRPAGFERPGMQRPPMNRPQVMPRPQGPSMGRPSGNSPFGMGPMPNPPVSGTNPVGRPRPNIIPMPDSMPPGMDGGMVAQPGQQPIEENQLWRTYNRLLGGDRGSMGPRMLF